MAERLVLWAVGCLAVSGVPGLFLGRKAPAGQRVASGLTLLAGLLGLAGAALGLARGGSGLAVPWAVPGGDFRVRVDALSAFFLVPVFLMGALGSLYGHGYWPQAAHPGNGRRLRFFYGVLTASMALLLIARNGLLFLCTWEGMALAAFFLVTTEDEEPAVREAGWHYLAATHLGTLCLLALFGLLRRATGSFELGPVAAGALGPAAAAAAFFLALAGFGLKAGLMPLHVWLPGAHANAPSHVSALLSGVMIKMGIYGLVRLGGWLPAPPPWWGGALLTLGAVSGVLGVAYAVGQHDLKRLLAYHSIENIGIIAMGLGLALLGRSFGRADWVALGLGGALLHVWNHGLFKSLLFLSAGSVIHTAHTREIDLLGGLARPMPRTALAFLVGAVAICGLPPLNGFVSELLIYLGLFRTALPGAGPARVGAAFAAPALALIGALAVACFVKVYGVVFLGEARSPRADEAREAPWTMVAPMAALAAACFAIGLFPAAVAPVLDRAVAAWSAGAPGLATLAPLSAVGRTGFGLLLLLATGAGWVALRVKRGPTAAGPTWDCGYAAPSSSMQYTASSFAQLPVGLFGWALRPLVRPPRLRGFFPDRAAFHSEVPDAVLDRAVLPLARAAADRLGRLRVLQQGRMQAYVLYILLVVVVLLVWR